jgi:hypothetical protein
MNLLEHPVIRVLDKEQTLAAIQHGNDRAAAFPDLDTFKHWNIKSQWFCDLLDEREKVDGSQYNAGFLRWFEKENNVGPFDENDSVASMLIYNAQRYRRIDKAIREGWKPLTPELVQEAIDRKAKIEMLGENMLGGQVQQAGYRPLKRDDGIYFVMAPRARNRGFRADGTRSGRIILK